MDGSSKAYGPNLIRNGEFEYGFDLWTIRGNATIGAHESGGNRAEFTQGGGTILQYIPEFGRRGLFRASFRLALEDVPAPGQVTLHITIGDRVFEINFQSGAPVIWSVETQLPGQPDLGNLFIIESPPLSFARIWVDDVIVEEVLPDPLIKNGDFSANDDHWTLIDAKVQYGHAILEPFIEGSVGQDITLPGPGKYLLTFDASSTKDEPRCGEIDVVGKGQDPKHQLILYAIRGTEPNHVACVFDTQTAGLSNDISIAIATHFSDAETIIDNVVLVKL
jgi:hypothetical protein